MPRYKVKYFNLFICVLLFLCNILLSHNITGANSKTKIIIRGDKEYAPYEFLNNNGKPDGFNVDLIKAVMKEMKIEYDLQLIGRRDCLANFSTDDVDIITSAIEFSDDQETSLFSFPTQKTNFVSVCRKGFRPFSTETLKDLNIIIREGSFCDSILKEKLKKVITVDNLCYGLTMLDRGRGDALIGDESVVKYYIRQNSLKNLEIRTLSLPESRLRFGIKKDRPSLRDSVNAGLERIMKNGTYDNIYSKWFGLESNEEATMSDNYLLILYISGAIIIIFLIFIIILQRRVKSIKRSLQNSYNDNIININNKNAILDSLPCGIAIYDKNLRQQYINQPIADVFGITGIKEHLAKHVYIADNTQLTEQEQILVKKGVDFEMIKEYDMSNVLKNKYFETNTSNKIHLNCKVRNLRDSSGNITSVIFLLTDVTDLNLKSQKLSLYKDQLTMALAAGKMDVWEYDIPSDKVTILYSCNDTTHVFTFEEALSLIHPKERHIFRAEIEKLKSGKISNTQCITRNFNPITEKYEYLQKNIQARHGDNGNIAKIIGVSYNVNELYEHELELNSLLSSLILSMKTSKVAYYSFLPADMSVQKFIENKFVTIFNSIEELYKYIHPDDCFYFKKITVQLYNCKIENATATYRAKLSLEETKYLYFETQFSLLRDMEGKVYAILASTIDVTNRELPRIKQQELIDTISVAMKTSKTTAWSFDLTKKKYRIFNNDTHEYCDYTDTVDLVHPEDKLKYNQYIQGIINGQKMSSCNIFRLLDSTTNTYRYKEYSAKILCNKSGEPVELVGITTDTTDILNEKAETEKMKIQYETMFNSLKAGVEIRDKRGTLLRFNKAYAQILGIEKPEELYSSTRNIDQIYEIDSMARKALKEMCEYHGTVVYDFDYIREKEIYTTSRTGKIYLFANIAPLTDNKGNILGTVSLIEDITATENQQRIIDEERMKKDLALKGSKTTLWTFDSAQKIFVLSGFYQEITNQDLTLESIISCVHPDDLPLFKAKMEDMCSSKNCSFCIDLRYRTVDDHEWIYATMSSAPFKFDETGKCIAYIGYLKDNTREVKLNYALKQSAQRIDYIFEQSDIDSWDYIPGNEILIIYPNNKSENKITIIPDADHIRSFVKEDQDTIKSVFNRMNNLEIQGFSITVKRKINGKYEYINLNGTPIKDINGNVIKYSGLRRNITDIMEVQERLKKEKEKALQADKLKSAFLANMSHEIRTPLNAIVGFSQLLDSVTEEGERKQYIDIISTNSDILLKLIHDILDLSKIEAGITEYVMSDFDLYSVMDEIATFVSQKTINTEVDLIKEYPTEKFIIHSDRNKVAQMLINLVTNSVKYTHRGTISIGYKKGSGRNVILFVKDTGIGIPKNKRHRIFQRFDKLDSFVQGTGLGLVITKSIAEGLGGKIEFDSTEGEGTTFRIILPTAKE